MSLPCATCHADCCGPVPLSRRRIKQIVEFLREKKSPEELEVLASQERNDITCAFVDTRDHSCSIYEARPRQCELYGRVEGMKCPHVPALVDIIIPRLADTLMALETDSGVIMLSHQFNWRRFMGGTSYDETEAAKPSGQATTEKRKVELLICKCEDCTHWEIVKEGEKTSILCKTCGLEVPITFTFDEHSQIHWAEHER